MGYYRKFIKNFSSIAKPLNSLLKCVDNTKKGNKTRLIEWGPDQQMSFDKLKEACYNAPVLAYADYKQPFILYTDSSLDGLGAVLYQKDGEGKLGVIAYANRSLTKSEGNYPAHKFEFLALKWAVTDKFREYLMELAILKSSLTTIPSLMSLPQLSLMLPPKCGWLP